MKIVERTTHLQMATHGTMSPVITLLLEDLFATFVRLIPKSVRVLVIFLFHCTDSRLRNIFSNETLACPKPFWVADGYCDDETNTIGCGYDGGDCCMESVSTEYCIECQCYETGYYIIFQTSFRLTIEVLTLMNFQVAISRISL